MSVIIRLQNLPWSANALDIRQFFKGLSIPEGGVHIVGGEMGDAFIAFSTDEDARQAMMKDCTKLNEVQIRLLLSSRAEMQKVIETARQQSLLALQKAGGISIPTTPSLTAPTTTPLPTPQPSVIATSNLQSILGAQLGNAPSFQVYQQQAGVTLTPTPTIKVETNPTDTEVTNRRESNESLSRERRRSTSRERRRSRSKDRNDRSSKRRRERSRSRSRERDRRSGRQQRSIRRSRSRERSRDRSRERARNGSRSNRNSRDDNGNNRPGRENTIKSAGKGADMKVNEKTANISPWSIPPINAYQTDATQNVNNNNNTLMAHMQQKSIAPPGIMSNAYTTSVVDVSNKINNMISNPLNAVLPGFQNFNNTISPNNYNVNALSNPLATPLSGNDAAANSSLALQNPYTAAFRSSTSNSNSQDCNRSPATQFDTNLQQQQQQQQQQTTTPFQNSLLDKNLIISQQDLQSLGAVQTIATAQTNLIQQQQQQLQQPIAFANTNPYAQIYPSLFAQAAAASTGIANPTHTTTSQNLDGVTPNVQDKKFNQRLNAGSSQGQRNNNNNGKHDDISRSCSIKITNMCVGTTYSDLRKFFSGLFIPHNGIKMVNDKFGERTGVAYIQFSRNSCVAKAMVRNNTSLRTKRVSLEIVSDEEFRNIEDSYKPGRDREGYNRYDYNDNRGNGINIGGNVGDGGYENRRDGRYDQKTSSPSQTNDDNENAGDNKTNKQTPQVPQEPFNVLYIEDIPAMTTEHDIMKMFSNYTIFDILLTVSPENRREFTAYVKFSREEEAKTALLESARYVIGRRKVRTRAAKEEEMEKAKEKLRLANEQLKKEEEEEATNKANQTETHAKGINKNETGMEMDVEDETNDRINSKEFGNDVLNEYQNTRSPTNRSSRDSSGDPRLRRQRHNNFLDDNIGDIGLNSNGRNLNMNIITNMIRQQIESNSGGGGGGGHNFNQLWKPPSFQAMQMNSIENNFVILKNCDYNTHMNDVAQLMFSANFVLKHIEALRNGRQMFTGEFIVEFSNSTDALMAVKRFNNTLFRNRNLRVRAILPQEIADRIGKPFMNYMPSGRGPPQRNQMNTRGNFDGPGRGFGDRNNNFRMGGGGHMGPDNFPRFGNNRSRGGSDGMDGRRSRPIPRGNFNNRRNFHNSDGSDYKEDNTDGQSNDTDDNNGDKSDNGDDVVSVSSNGGDGATETDGMPTGIPEKFNKPGCVIALENVPYKADLKDIIEFFNDFGVSHDDVIRRFNDDGSPTGDARVAFSTPTKAQEAFEAKQQQMILKRTIRLSMV